MATRTRKLAAIMPACHSNGQYTAGRLPDIAGYTALMGKDEDQASELRIFSASSLWVKLPVAEAAGRYNFFNSGLIRFNSCNISF